MRIIGNVLWFLFGGAILAFLWFIAGLICCLTIIGIPVGLQCFKFARLILWPFGHELVSCDSTMSFLINFLWILVFGWGLAATSVVIGLVWCITIVGIPFGIQYFKFAKLALSPFGTRIV